MKLLALLVLANAAHAGGPEASVDFLPASGTSDPGAAALSDEVRRIWSLGFAASTPTPPIKLVPDRWLLVNTLAASDTRLVSTDAAWPGTDDETRHITSLRYGLLSVVTPSERWLFLATVTPALASDFASPLSSRDLVVTATGIVGYHPAEHLTVGLGGGYVSFLGGPMPIALGLFRGQWEAGRIDLLLPQSAVFMLEPTEAFAIGLDTRIKGGYYHQTTTDTAFPKGVFLQHSTGTAGPRAELTLRGRVRVFATGGYTFLRRLVFSEDVRTQIAEVDLDPTWAARLGFEILTAGPEKEAASDEL